MGMVLGYKYTLDSSQIHRLNKEDQLYLHKAFTV